MPNHRLARLVGGLLCLTLSLGVPSGASNAAKASEHRMTPLVRAVQESRPSVVNIQGQKTVKEAANASHSEISRQVNGMGTGVVIDPRGYILTNYHVVDGVRQINVTFADRRAYVAKIVAFDPRTDLAVIKINASQSLPVIRIGTSSDLMEAESVVAVGNAFGYENTVTVGIISALDRDVQVSDTQAYDDLIQTDASINPGNSGGPLLNIDGEMIGVNVAVRAGAQGIGFAIPVDAAMEVAARLMSVEEIENKWHGLTLRSSLTAEGVLVDRVAPGSPAAESGFKPGDVITHVADVDTERRLDVERGLLGLGNRAAQVTIRRANEQMALDLTPSRSAGKQQVAREPRGGDTRAWDVLGLSLEIEPDTTFQRTNSKYQGGLRIVDVRPESPAAREGIVPGDILVGMHRWQTASLKDLEYIITRTNLPRMGEVRFYIYRDNETLYTDVNVASRTTTSSDSLRK